MNPLVFISGRPRPSTTGTPAFDAANSIDWTLSSAYLNFDIAQGAMSNGLVVVGISYYAEAERELTVTYETVPMVFVDKQADSPGSQYTALYILPLGSTSSQTRTIEVSFDGLFYGATAGAITLSGVNQSSPIGTPAKDKGTTSTATVGVSSTSGDLVVDIVSVSNPTGTVGAGQTARWTETLSGPDGFAGSSTEVATGASTTMSWTLSGSVLWSIIGVAVKAA